MRHHWKSIGLLLLTTVVIDGVIASIARERRDSAVFIWAAFIGLMLSQTSLAGIWMGLGRTPSPLRILGAIGVIIAWSFVFSERHPADINQLIVVLMLPFATISACLLLARWRGLHCVDTFDPVSRVESDRSPWQFSISNLLAWTTVLAIILGVFKWLGLLASLPDPHLKIVDVVILGPGLVLVAVAALWMALGARPPIRRTPALVLAVAVSIGATCLIEPPQPRDFAVIAWFMILDAVFLVGLLLVFRRVGYRLRWKRRLATGSGASSCDERAE
jgi:hypothetical protein